MSLSKLWKKEQRTNHKIIDLEKEGTFIKQKEENQTPEISFLHVLKIYD